jgi:hypothetical protein
VLIFCANLTVSFYPYSARSAEGFLLQLKVEARGASTLNVHG